MESWRIFKTYFRLNVLNELQYRANFFMELFTSLLNLGFGLAGLALIFMYTDALSGWSPAQLVVVMGVYTLITGFIAVFIQPNMGRLIGAVGDGELDHTLLKPADAQLQVSVSEFQIWRVTDVVIGTVVIILGLVQVGQAVGVWNTLAFFFLLLCGGVIIYCFFLILATTAFWLIRVWEIMGLFNSITQAGKYPVGIYPAWMRMLLTFLVPVAFAVTLPAEALTGRLTWETILVAVGITVAGIFLSRFIWKRGLKRYSGASA